MTEDLFKFINETTKENFISIQNAVISNPEYHPYSNDLSTMEDMLDAGKFEDVDDFYTINILLSPRAHLYKNYAFEKLNKENEAKSELILAQKIMEGLSLTGDGSQQSPYFVTRISDERDMLSYFQEQFASQRLINDHNRYLDCITSQSGKNIYFDITTPYLKMQELLDSGKIKTSFRQGNKNADTSTKKWWQFWK